MIPTLSRALLASLTATALLSTLVTAQTRDVNRKYERVDKYGYSVNLPEDWKAALISPEEKHLVGKFAPDQVEISKRGDWAAEGASLEIVRLSRAVAATGEGAKEEREKREDEKKRDEIIKRIKGLSRDANLATTVDEYLEIRFDAEGRYRPEKLVVGRGRSKLTGTLREFNSDVFFVYCGVFTAEGFDWAVVYRCREDYAKDWKPCFVKSMKTFRVFEGEETATDAVAKLDTDTSKLSKDEQKDLIAASIEGQSGWWAHTTDNYVFLSNSDNKRLIQTLAKDVETLRAKVYEELFPPTNEITAVGTVRVFSDQGEYYAYGGSRGSAGYWSSQHEELVLFDGFEDMSAKSSIESTKSVMYHEAFHQYIYYAVGDLAPHSWFNEGHGDYFAGHLVRGRRVVAQPFEWRIDFLRNHLTLGRNLIPVRSLVRLPQSEYYRNAGLKYAQGWALVYYLRNVAPKKQWRQAPDKYFEYLRDNVAAFKRKKSEDPDASGESIPGIPGVQIFNFEDQEKIEEILAEAVNKGFEGIDMDELDAAFVEWVESIT